MTETVRPTFTLRRLAAIAVLSLLLGMAFALLVTKTGDQPYPSFTSDGVVICTDSNCLNGGTR